MFVHNYTDDSSDRTSENIVSGLFFLLNIFIAFNNSTHIFRDKRCPLHTAPPLMGRAYRDRYQFFICNGKTSNENMISDDSVLYTRGKDPSHADGGVSGVVLVLSPAHALWAMAMAVRQAAMLSRLAAMAGRLVAMAGRLAAVVEWPARLPLEVATPGTQAAQAGTPEEKPARVSAAQAATGEARR
jgi:hypothetical protein